MQYECHKCGHKELRSLEITIRTHARNALCPECKKARLEMEHVATEINREKTNNFKRYLKRKKKNV